MALTKLKLEEQLKEANVRIGRLATLLKSKNKQPDLIKDDSEQLFRDLDIQQYCNRYKWKGLPDYLPSWLLEHMLYMRGSLAGYFNGGVLYVLPYAQTGGINTYGIPNAVKTIAYNGINTAEGSNEEKELPVNVNGKPNENASAVLLYDRIPTYWQGGSPLSRYVLINTLLNQMADVISRIKINLVNSTAKHVVYVKNEKQKDTMEQAVSEAFTSGSPFIIMTKGDNDYTNSEEFSAKSELETQSLFETWESLNSIRCMTMGLNNQGAFEKKERIVTDELGGNVEQSDLVFDAGLCMRKLWLDQMRGVYPEYADILNKIEVTVNENDTQKQPADKEQIPNAEVNDNDK